MKSNFFILIIFIFNLNTVFSQDQPQKKDTTYWKRGGLINLGFAQSSFSKWSAGGINSIAFNAKVSLYNNYKRNKSTWDNTIDLGYGIIKQDIVGQEDAWVKNNDLLELNSKYGQHAFKHWYYSALANFRTQVAPGFINPLATPTSRVLNSDFLAPGFGLLALGMDYKPGDYFSMFVSPLTGKLTVVGYQSLANTGAFGVTPAVLDTAGNIITPGKKIRQEMGGYIRIQSVLDFNKFKNAPKFLKNIILTNKVDAFSNYLNNPQNIDIFWDALLAMKVNEYIGISLNTTIIYDNDIDLEPLNMGVNPRTQFRQIFMAGFTYKLK